MPIHRSQNTEIAYFISSHGFGHAARACAVMSALHALDHRLHFNIYTEAPPWFFQQEPDLSFSYFNTKTDVGLVQLNPMQHDIDKTLDELDAFLPFEEHTVSTLVAQVSRQGNQVILCDISALGILIANTLQIPSVLIGNFTWDWIYSHFLKRNNRFERHIQYLQELYGHCQYRIHAQPNCHGNKADLTCHPISRGVRQTRQQLRQQLNLPAHTKVITLTMGGIPNQLDWHSILQDLTQYRFIIPGKSARQNEHPHIMALAHDTRFYHPDILNCSDLVIGKLGYSTLAETYYAGIPLLYFMRDDFIESQALSEFANHSMNGLACSIDDIASPAWQDLLGQRLTLPLLERDHSNGAAECAGFILSIL